jgi:hypothetical protein
MRMIRSIRLTSAGHAWEKQKIRTGGDGDFL